MILEWSSAELDDTRAIAWGDYDGDGDLDLAAGNYGRPDRLYRNDNGALTTDAVWSSVEADDTRSVAWGDYDGDGDLDLAVGNNGQPNRLYRNNGGILTTSAVWWSDEADITFSVAWGDYDDDGDLDLAVGNSGQSNRLYRNDGGALTTSAVWSSVEADDTRAVAWGDYDDDGDLDLGVGNNGQPNRLYRNDGGLLTTRAVWSSVEADDTRAVAWGDYDDDGDLDLAVGNSGQSNRLYHNDGGVLTTRAVWSSVETDHTLDLAWGDYDSDGDLDLVVGNFDQPNRLYHNDNGMLTISAVWSSVETDATRSMAWGDYDGDGDLDLAVGNTDQPDRLYRNDIEALTAAAVWSSVETDDTRAVGWGDYDGDGDLDLATGNEGQSIRLYRNDDGILVDRAAWRSDETDVTRSMAWGDYDGDGDLDLVVGNNGQPNRLYRNDGGMLTTSAVWSSDEIDATNAVAWGDYDGDGDLDLAVGNNGQPNRLYRNDGGMLTTSAVWSSDEIDATNAAAWGDYDGDGDLDLAVGNDGQPNRLYRNDGGMLTTSAVWSSDEANDSNAVAWGDYDGDGDLDLAVGNWSQPNCLYRNDNGTLLTSAVWSSVEADDTRAVAWGDYDGDSDLDLAVGNQYQPNRLYHNDGGELTTSAVWSSVEADPTNSVAWGDYDSDGDLDLAAGNYYQNSRLYCNLRRSTVSLVNNPSYVTIPRPGPTDDADAFSTPHIIRAVNIPITYTLFDPEGDVVAKIFPEFSSNGGGQWFPATQGPGGDGMTALATLPNGMPHIFIWNAEADLIKSDNVVFRIRAQSSYTHSPILWPAMAGKSPSFRVEAATWFIKVVDEGSNGVAGSTVYYDGQPMTCTVSGIGLTDRAGLMNPGLLEPGKPLIALSPPLYEDPTVRDVHDGWAYRIYLTNLNLDVAGVPRPFNISRPGEQRMVISRTNPLALFNVVVSVEWDADEEYLDTIADAFRRASDYLYDVTDGQMAFGQVTIYDNAEHWADADFQISTKNTVRPYAFIGGITSDDTAHSIRVGRFWNGSSGNQGDWNEPYGYRTLIHEFGHYGLYLYDEYFVRLLDAEGHFTGEARAACTGLDVLTNASDTTNASLMYYQYNASELADSDRWTVNCRNTEQARVNGGPDWQTVVAHYGGTGWKLNTPSSRGNVMAGPEVFPSHLLPFPVIEVHDAGPGGSPRQLAVVGPDGHSLPNALVALYTTPHTYTVAIDQGLTDQQGHLTIYGAVEGDTIQAASFDGAYAGAVTVDGRTAYTLTLSPTSAGRLAARASSSSPYLNLIPGSEGDTLLLEVHSAPAGSLPLSAVVIPGEGGGSPQSTSMAYSTAKDTYVGQVSLAGVGLGSGEVRVSGVAGGQWVSINSDYNLLWVLDGQANDLASEDGNFQLHVDAGSLLNHADAYAVVLPTGYVPGPLPPGKRVLGSAHEVRLSGAATGLTKPGLLTMYYHPEVMGLATDLAIYHWNAANEEWERVGGERSELDNSVTAPVQQFGTYALMGEHPRVYLPIVLKQ